MRWSSVARYLGMSRFPLARAGYPNHFRSSVASLSASSLKQRIRKGQKSSLEKPPHTFAHSVDRLHTTNCTIDLAYLHGVYHRSNARMLGAYQGYAKPCSGPGPLYREQCRQAAFALSQIKRISWVTYQWRSAWIFRSILSTLQSLYQCFLKVS